MEVSHEEIEKHAKNTRPRKKKKKNFNDSEAVRVDKSNFGYKHYDCVKKYQSLVT